MFRLALVVLSSILLTSCGTVPTKKEEGGTHLHARITYYHRHEDKYGNHTAAGVRAKEGITIAAHPTIKLGTLLFIPALALAIGNGHFTVQDRGKSVTSRKATHGKLPVFDVYIECATRRIARRRIAELERKIGLYAEVYFDK